MGEPRGKLKPKEELALLGLEQKRLVEEVCADPRKGIYLLDRIFDIQERRLDLADLIWGPQSRFKH
jgi:hypothetical protein